MKTFSKSLIAAAVTTATLISAPAQAAYIWFGGASAMQGTSHAGLTSTYGNYIDAATNTVINPLGDTFLETFDAPATGLNSFGYSTRPLSTDVNASKIIFDSLSSGGFATLNPNAYTGVPPASGDLTIAGTMGIRSGTVSGVAAAPGGDCSNTNGGVTAWCNQTNFAYGPGPLDYVGKPNASVKVSYDALLNFYPASYSIEYLGIYYGSIDTYNWINFYKADGSKVVGTGVLADGKLTGTEILNAFRGTSGNQTANTSNVFLNIAFEAGDEISSFEFVTEGVAVEMDNVVTHLGYNVPEPGSMALVGLGLMGLAGLRRRKQQA